MIGVKAKEVAGGLLPSHWIEKNLWVDDFTRFGFEGREYLRQIHDVGDRRILIKSGRQVEKSYTLAAKVVTYCGLIPTFKAIYISPSQQQTRLFSHAKLDNVLKSPHVRRTMFNPLMCTSYVFEKSFLNGSTILMNYAGDSADRVRGASADLLLIDEVQDIMPDNFPVLEETLTHSKWNVRIYTGTPKTLNNPIETRWKRSTQCEWLIKCDGCSHWNFQDVHIIGKKGPICTKCGAIINPANGRWVPSKKHAQFLGFRISQTMVPWVYGVRENWRDLVEKYDTWPENQFFNEVLGISHEKGANVLTETEIKACCSDRKNANVRDPNMYFDALYAGIDWGAGLGSYTILTIGGMHAGKFRVLHIRKFDAEKDEYEYQVEEIIRVIARFGVRLAACDWGAGFMQNKMLSERMAGTCDVVQIYESNIKKRTIEWNAKSRMYVVNRNAILGNLFTDIKNKKIEFFNWGEFEEYAQDFLGVFQEYNASLRLSVFSHPENIPDDAVHATAYCKSAWMIGSGQPIFG